MAISTIGFQLDLYRYDASVRADVLEVLTSAEAELVAMLASSKPLTNYSRTRLKTLLNNARAILARYYADAQLPLFEAVAAVAEVAASVALPVALEAAIPPANALAAIAGDAIIQGATQAAWWARQEADAAFRFERAVRGGLVLGETNQQIVGRVREAMDLTRKNAAALVQTSVATVANDARMVTFRENEDLIARYRWVTALDGHVCPECAARADLTWLPDGTPEGHSIPFQTPPIHFNDRCLIVAETKTFKELGIDLPEPKPGQRASADGPVSVNVTFDDWLSSQDEATQADVLGAGRAQLWRDGKISLADLVNGRGRPMTLAQLREKYAL